MKALIFAAMIAAATSTKTPTNQVHCSAFDGFGRLVQAWVAKASDCEEWVVGMQEATGRQASVCRESYQAEIDACAERLGRSMIQNYSGEFMEACYHIIPNPCR